MSEVRKKIFLESIFNKINVESVAMLFLISGLLFQITRLVLSPYPILSGDEYAYYAHSVYVNKLLYELDEYMQRTTNPLFFVIHKIGFSLFNDKGWYFYRLLNLVEWISSIFLLIKAVKLENIFLQRLVVAFALFLPSSMYVLAYMPEVNLVFLFSLLFYVNSRLYNKNPYELIVYSGLICGLGLLVKAHFSALVLSQAVFLLVVFFLDKNKISPIKIFIYLILFICSVFCFYTVVEFIIIEFLNGAMPDWGLQTYTKILFKSTNSGLLNSLKIFSYFGILFLSIFYIFPFGIYGLIKSSFVFLRKKDRFFNHINLISFFLIVSFFAYLAMVSYFSFKLSGGREFAALRIHGRYLLPIITTLPLISFISVNGFSKNDIKTIGLLGVFSTLLCYIGYRYFFKLYPWDFPELMCFYVFPNHYSWAGGVSVGDFTFVLFFLLYLFIIVRPNYGKVFLIFQLLIMLGLSNVNTNYWLKLNFDVNNNFRENGRVLASIINKSEPGDILVVGARRHGSMSNFLSNFHNHQAKVLSLPPNSKIESKDINKYSWIILTDNYKIENLNKNKILLNGFTVYSNDLLISLPEKETWKENKFKYFFSKSNSEIELEGFNEPEDWGVWTSSDTASILLPFIMTPGNYKMIIHGWVNEKNLKKAVKIEIGSNQQELNMNLTMTNHEIDFYLSSSSDKIKVIAPIFQPDQNNPGRQIGVALHALEIIKK